VSDENAVVAVLVDWYAAMERHDLAAVAAALTPAFLLVEHDQVMDAATLMAGLAAAVGQGRQTAELSEFDIVVEGELAWCTHRNQEVWYPTAGEAVELEFLETVILRRHQASWRIERYHASRVRPVTL
jgi:ketosteroid isomerase-like protein